MLGSILVLVSALAAPELPVNPGTAITFDGQVEAAEWADAFALPAKYPGGEEFELRWKRNGQWLAIALKGARAYAGEAVQLQVADEYGAWVTELYLGVAHPAAPPALWRRGPPMGLAEQEPAKAAGCPRAARVRVSVDSGERWSAEYLVRLSALGIGRADRRRFKARLTVLWAAPTAGTLTMFPPQSRPLDPTTFAALVSPDAWGEGERWEPVSPEVSREFDDHELLHRLFREFARFSAPTETKEIVISNATRPRALEKVDNLRKKLEAGRARNPTLPVWTYFLGRLVHEANLYKEARSIVESVPAHLMKLEPFVILAVEHYLDTEEWARAFKMCDDNQATPGIFQRVKFILSGWRLSRTESKSIEKDDGKAEKNPRVRLTVKDKGAIVIELFEDDARNAVLNFIALVQSDKYYDGMQFHDAIGGSHVTIGDPRTRPGATVKEDGPAWRLRSDKSERPMLRGYVATVPAGPSSAQHGSQFIISVAPMLEQAVRRTVFGRVVEGLEILENIEVDDRLEKIEVVRRRNHTYDPLPARLR